MNTIEQGVLIRFVLLENPDILENLRIDFDLLVVPDRVFTQEVKAKNVGRLQRDVFTTERATPNGIGLVFAFLVASSKSKNINEVHSRSSLPIRHLFRLEIFSVICPDPVDVVLRGACVNPADWISVEDLTHLQFTRLFKLDHVALSLERASRSEENVLVVLIDVLDPIGEPSDGVIMDHLFPRSNDVGLRDGLMLADVYRHVFRTDTVLEAEELAG